MVWNIENWVENLLSIIRALAATMKQLSHKLKSWLHNRISKGLLMSQWKS